MIGLEENFDAIFTLIIWHVIDRAGQQRHVCINFGMTSKLSSASRYAVNLLDCVEGSGF